MFCSKPGISRPGSPKSGAAGLTCLLDSLLLLPISPRKSSVEVWGGDQPCHFRKIQQETLRPSHTQTTSDLYLGTQEGASGQESLLTTVTSNGRMGLCCKQALLPCPGLTPRGLSPSTQTRGKAGEGGALPLKVRNIRKTRNLLVVLMQQLGRKSTI